MQTDTNNFLSQSPIITVLSEPLVKNKTATSRNGPQALIKGDGFIVLNCFEAVVNNHFTRRPALCVCYVNYAT